MEVHEALDGFLRVVIFEVVEDVLPDPLDVPL
jgi:hypothetical protein